MKLLGILALSLGTQFSATAQEGPPMANGVIADASLTQDPAGVRAKATATITTFMSKGAQVCDDKGQNCHSAFGQGGMDFNGVQSSAQRTLNVQSFSFSDPGGSNNVSAQLGTLALSCGDYRTKSVAGVAFKLTGCTVNSNGDAQVSYRVCTAPARGLSVSQPANGMECSDDPTQPNFRPKPGMVCLKAACDTEPEGSLNGWSPEQTSVFTANLPASASAQEVSNNGLGLVFYPSLSGGVPADYRADSDNMTAVKVVQTFVNSSTDQAAVGLKIAFRQKTQLTKEKIAGGVYSTPNPREHTAAWDTITKLQGNARIPQLQAKYASKGTKCIQQIQAGLGNDGTVTVCEEDYENEAGIKPLARTAQVAAEGQNCASTAQCLQEVVNSTAWQQKCRSDVPLALRKCATTQDYETSTRTFTRTASTEVCHERRAQFTYGCETNATLGSAIMADFTQPPVVAGGLSASVTRLGAGHYSVSGSMGWNWGNYGYFTFYLDAPVGQLAVYVHSTDDTSVFAHNGKTFMVAPGVVSTLTGASLGSDKNRRNFSPLPGWRSVYIADRECYNWEYSFATPCPGYDSMYATAKVSDDCFENRMQGTSLLLGCASDGKTYLFQNYDIGGSYGVGQTSTFELVQGANTIEVVGHDPRGGGGVNFTMVIKNYAMPMTLENTCVSYENAK